MVLLFSPRPSLSSGIALNSILLTHALPLVMLLLMLLLRVLVYVPGFWRVWLEQRGSRRHLHRLRLPGRILHLVNTDFVTEKVCIQRHEYGTWAEIFGREGVELCTSILFIERFVVFVMTSWSAMMSSRPHPYG